MPRIVRVLAVPAVGADYHEDLTALRSHYVPLPARYTAKPVTAGFYAVRQLAEAVSVGLELDDGHIAWGDCVGSVYNGRPGCDPIFRSAEGLATLQQVVAPALQDRTLTSFRKLAAEIDMLTEPAQAAQTQPVHAAIRYGLSQAVLQAVALASGKTMAEIVAEEWDLPLPSVPIPIHAQSITDLYQDVDKMVVRRVSSLPDTLPDNKPEQFDEDGRLLLQYIRWLSERIGQLSDVDYNPTIHLNVHGRLGQICQNNLGHVLGQLYALEEAAKPYPLRIVSPVMMDTRQAQIETIKTLRQYIRIRKMKVQLVADEWVNRLDDINAFIAAGSTDMIRIKTPELGSVHNLVDAILACKANSIGALMGGSRAETDLSARVSVHIALATRADVLMAMPGKDIDEGIMFTQNEIARTLACIAKRA